MTEVIAAPQQILHTIGPLQHQNVGIQTEIIRVMMCYRSKEGLVRNLPTSTSIATARMLSKGEKVIPNN
jgi:hypothetical protein